MKHLFIKIITTYKTLIYVTLFLSLSLNYMTLTGQLDMVGYWKNSPSTVPVSSPIVNSNPFSQPSKPTKIKPVKKDWLSDVSEAQPVNLFKSKKKIGG